MTDASGTVVWAADYKPFGEVNIITNTITNNLRFPGQYFDQETGLHYNYYLDYNPAIGRYIEADPFGIDVGGAEAGVLVAYCATHREDCKDLKKIHCKAALHDAHHPFGFLTERCVTIRFGALKRVCVRASFLNSVSRFLAVVG